MKISTNSIFSTVRNMAVDNGFKVVAHDTDDDHMEIGFHYSYENKTSDVAGETFDLAKNFLESLKPSASEFKINDFGGPLSKVYGETYVFTIDGENYSVSFDFRSYCEYAIIILHHYKKVA